MKKLSELDLKLMNVFILFVLEDGVDDFLIFLFDFVPEDEFVVGRDLFFRIQVRKQRSRILRSSTWRFLFCLSEGFSALRLLNITAIIIFISY